MTYRHAGAQPVYAPNSYGGPQADPSQGAAELVGRGGRDRPLRLRAACRRRRLRPAGTLYRDVMTPTDREHLVANIVAHASAGVSGGVQERVVAYWTDVDAELGARVAAGLGLGNAPHIPHPGIRPHKSAYLHPGAGKRVVLCPTTNACRNGNIGAP